MMIKYVLYTAVYSVSISRMERISAYHRLSRSESCCIFLVSRDDAVSPVMEKKKQAIKTSFPFSLQQSMHMTEHRMPCSTHLLVIPPPGGSPGMFSLDRNFIT